MEITSYKNKGISLNPTHDLARFECFTYDNFAVNYSTENIEDKNYVKSRTLCVIKYAGYPLIWFNCLKTETAQSTTEVEFITLFQATREVLPLRELITELQLILNIPDVEPF